MTPEERACEVLLALHRVDQRLSAALTAVGDNGSRPNPVVAVLRDAIAAEREAARGR